MPAERGLIFVLVHSPLMGLLSWAFVAQALWDEEFEVIVPGLHAADESHAPYWQQHVDAVRTSIETLPDDTDIVLVGHSGAGLLLPAIAEVSARPVAGYIFVDADLPVGGTALSRLDRFSGAEKEAQQETLRRSAADGKILPFPMPVLKQLIPDADVRRQIAEELEPVPLTIYEEPIPVPAGWPEAPVAYLGFRESREPYAASLERVRAEGWPFAELRGGHLHLLVEPEQVAAELVHLAEAMDL